MPTTSDFEHVLRGRPPGDTARSAVLSVVLSAVHRHPHPGTSSTIGIDRPDLGEGQEQRT